MLKDDALITEFKDRLDKTNRALSLQRSEATKDQAFYAGNQMYYESGITDRDRKRMVVFNKVKPFVNAVLGLMIQTRRKPEYNAVVQDSEEQQARSEYTNAISEYVRKNANADQIETMQDRDMLITGVGALDSNIIYLKNPDGEVAMERVHFNDVGWDPNAREVNLLDADFVWRKKDFKTKDAEKLFGADAEDFDNAVDEGTKQYNPYGGAYNATVTGENLKEDMVSVYYYQWREREKYYRIENPIYTQQDPFVVQVLGAAFQRLQQLETENEDYDEAEMEDVFSFRATDKYLIATPHLKKEVEKICKNLSKVTGVEIECEAVDYDKYCYYTAILSGKKVFDKFRSIDQQGFTIKFKTGDWDDHNKVWTGMVRSMRMPSQYANKAFTEMLYVIASNSKGGVLYETSAITDIKKFERDYTRNDAAVQVADGALANGRIQPKAQAALPSGYESILSYSDSIFPSVTGVNLEMLGMADNGQVSGILEKQRVKQAISALATYFDSIGLYQIEHARLMLCFFRILAENSPRRLVPIITQEGARRFEQMLKDKMADEYQIDIGEAPDSPTQKDERAKVMMEFSAATAMLGINTYAIAAKYLPIKQDDMQQLLEILQPKSPPPPDPIMVEREQLINADLKASVDKKAAEAQNQQNTSLLTTAKTGYEVARTRKEGVDTLSAVKSLGEGAIMPEPVNGDLPNGSYAIPA